MSKKKTANVRIVTRSDNGSHHREHGANIAYPATVTIDVAVGGRKQQATIKITSDGMCVETA